MAIRINHVNGTAVCDVHGDEPCDHMDRLSRKFGLMVYRIERQAARFTGDPREARGAAAVSATILAPKVILDSILERPLATTRDESPL